MTWLFFICVGWAIFCLAFVLMLWCSRDPSRAEITEEDWR